ncbi:hypothetical protein [Nocardia exalbida]|uniref:hypothetical protein n=1 Tax=Nocardia exalbida TaxID=290231 RepID=UPI0012F6AD0E|nr:hypothetical protein [Nocardia exalbida]
MMYTELVTKDIDEWEALSDSFLPSESRYRDPRNWWIRATVQDTVAHTLLRFDQRSERLAWRTPSHTRQGGKDYWLVVPQRAVGGVNTFEMNDTVMRVQGTLRRNTPRFPEASIEGTDRSTGVGP